MSDTAWRIVQAVLLAAVAIWAVSTGDYWMIGLVVAIFVGNFVALRLGNLGLATAPFWALTFVVGVVCVGAALLPFVPRVVGSYLFAGGIFAVLMMPLYRYGERSPGGSG